MFCVASESCLYFSDGQDLVEAKLRLERLAMDVQKCEKDIDVLDKTYVTYYQF